MEGKRKRQESLNSVGAVDGSWVVTLRLPEPARWAAWDSRSRGCWVVPCRAVVLRGDDRVKVSSPGVWPESSIALCSGSTFLQEQTHILALGERVRGEEGLLGGQPRGGCRAFQSEPSREPPGLPAWAHTGTGDASMSPFWASSRSFVWVLYVVLGSQGPAAHLASFLKPGARLAPGGLGGCF